MLQKLPVAASKIFVWAFIPYRIQQQKLISEYHDKPSERQELADVFAELGIKWKWQPLTLENMQAVVEEVAAAADKCIPVVLNYCDGFDEIDGYPGIAIAKLLEAKNIIFTGADASFLHLSDNKILMKRAFVKAGVSTAPYEVISYAAAFGGVCDRLGTPLIVKPAISYASYGISLQSVVNSDEQVNLQLQRLVQGQHGKYFPPESIFVEKFITGSEFTVLIVGSVHQPATIKIYPPVERIFHSSLAVSERFLTFDRYWAKYQEETSLSPEEPFYRYQLADPILHDKLCELSMRAYCAVGGNGYGRVDVRMDKNSQELFVLEVNANCGISSDDQTSVGNILRFSGTPFAQLMSEMIGGAFDRHYTKSQ
ncbi:ATP-grasp domain-containing protein [Microcoleus sp. FACHB-831]|uniref:ATP-grasp domain-containing protein n=1 Tax=Microcoleus sp. FACHB-831 TaxID=2692827 RepID=UPI0018EFEC8C|nr:ATP-grasp domain-containing protein [Microcoleus sp. FACHB-831]